MSEKMSRRFVVAYASAALIFMWFIPNFVRSSLGLSYQPSDYGMVVWVRSAVITLIVAIACEIQWPTAQPLKDGLFWKRVFLLAFLNGIVSGPLITSHFLNPSGWEWIIMPFVMAIFGRVQMALIGTIATASLLHSNPLVPKE